MERANIPFFVVGMLLLGAGLLTLTEFGVMSVALIVIGIVLLVRSQNDSDS